MGLDMYLYRFPRYKEYTPQNIMTVDEYFSWLESEKGKKYTFEDWCGYSVKDLPEGEDLEYFKKMRVPQKYCWDPDGKYSYVGLREVVAEWRKANAVHKWFVDNVQGGEDDCEWHDEVTKETLEELRDVCKEVIENAVLVNGKVINGYTWDGKREVPHYEDGKIVVNSEVCSALLPTADGFFFGGTEYNEWYLDDVRYTYDICTRLLEETDFDKQMIYYLSSW